jgi:GTP cyclohydrolase FolE2
MYVALPASQKGTHMSRFLEVLNKHHTAIRSDDVMAMCREMKQRLNADEAHLELTFPYFIDKPAPVSGQVGKIDVEVTFSCTSTTEYDDFILAVKVPPPASAPCSKEISQYGAHNQRCEMTVEVRVAEDAIVWVEDLVAVAEQSASTQVFSILKRPDEKYVTEAAYDNPSSSRTSSATSPSPSRTTTASPGTASTLRTTSPSTTTTPSPSSNATNAEQLRAAHRKHAVHMQKKPRRRPGLLP